MSNQEAIYELYSLITDVNADEIADHIKGETLQMWTNAWRCRAKEVVRVLEADMPHTEQKGEER